MRARISGRSAHGSRPYGADNPILGAGRLIAELTGGGAAVSITPEWRRLISRLRVDEQVRAALLNPALVDMTIPDLAPPFDAFAHACTRMTFSPTVIRSGTKTNVIPDKAELEFDVRTLPGQTTDEVLKILSAASGAAQVQAEFEVFNESAANSSSIETPLWAAMEQAVSALVPGGTCVPAVTTGGNDARFYRAMGAVAYGGGLLSERFAFKDFIASFHGPNERIDLDSLALSTEFFTHVTRQILS